MRKMKSMVAFAMMLMILAPASLFAASHREAPITAWFSKHLERL